MAPKKAGSANPTSMTRAKAKAKKMVSAAAPTCKEKKTDTSKVPRGIIELDDYDNPSQMNNLESLFTLENEKSKKAKKVLKREDTETIVRQTKQKMQDNKAVRQQIPEIKMLVQEHVVETVKADRDRVAKRRIDWNACVRDATLSHYGCRITSPEERLIVRPTVVGLYSQLPWMSTAAAFRAAIVGGDLNANDCLHLVKTALMVPSTLYHEIWDLLSNRNHHDLLNLHEDMRFQAVIAEKAKIAIEERINEKWDSGLFIPETFLLNNKKKLTYIFSDDWFETAQAAISCQKMDDPQVQRLLKLGSTSTGKVIFRRHISYMEAVLLPTRVKDSCAELLDKKGHLPIQINNLDLIHQDLLGECRSIYGVSEKEDSVKKTPISFMGYTIPAEGNRDSLIKANVDSFVKESIIDALPELPGFDTLEENQDLHVLVCKYKQGNCKCHLTKAEAFRQLNLVEATEWRDVLKVEGLSPLYREFLSARVDFSEMFDNSIPTISVVNKKMIKNNTTLITNDPTWGILEKQLIYLCYKNREMSIKTLIQRLVDRATDFSALQQEVKDLKVDPACLYLEGGSIVSQVLKNLGALVNNDVMEITPVLMEVRSSLMRIKGTTPDILEQELLAIEKNKGGTKAKINFILSWSFCMSGSYRDRTVPLTVTRSKINMATKKDTDFIPITYIGTVTTANAIPIMDLNVGNNATTGSLPLTDDLSSSSGLSNTKSTKSNSSGISNKKGQDAEDWNKMDGIVGGDSKKAASAVAAAMEKDLEKLDVDDEVLMEG